MQVWLRWMNFLINFLNKILLINAIRIDVAPNIIDAIPNECFRVFIHISEPAYQLLPHTLRNRRY